MSCEHCGAPISPIAIRCHYCGSYVSRRRIGTPVFQTETHSIESHEMTVADQIEELQAHIDGLYTQIGRAFVEPIAHFITRITRSG